MASSVRIGFTGNGRPARVRRIHRLVLLRTRTQDRKASQQRNGTAEGCARLCARSSTTLLSDGRLPLGRIIADSDFGTALVPIPMFRAIAAAWSRSYRSGGEIERKDNSAVLSVTGVAGLKARAG